MTVAAHGYAPAAGDRWRRLALAFSDSRNLLGLVFMLPAAALLTVFLAYPLGLGLWLGFTDANLGSAGRFTGIANYLSLAGDPVYWLSVSNTILYTVVASAAKFFLGLWLALLLNQNVPLKAFVRAIGWIYDTQFSVITWALKGLGLIDGSIDFLGNGTNARISVIVANVWRGIPFVAISLLAGLQTIPGSLYEAATLDGASSYQRFRYITLPMLTPIIAVVMTFSVLFTFTDFQLIYVLTRGGPVNATHLMATLAFQRAIPGGRLGEGAALASSMIPFLVAAVMFSYYGLQRRKWQQGTRD
jgi:multiple sugar transport system permease protein